MVGASRACGSRGPGHRHARMVRTRAAASWSPMAHAGAAFVPRDRAIPGCYGARRMSATIIEPTKPSPVTPRVRWLLIAVTILLLVFPVVDLVKAALKPNWNGYGGIDFQLYMDATRSWLAGGPFYHAYQLAGPYPIQNGDILYQPNALFLFVPFAVVPVVLSMVLWWAIPLGVTAWAVWRMRPPLIAWPFIAMCLAWPPFVARTVAGNPVMWAMAAVALGCLFRWPSVFALIKASLFPFALLGIRDRRWWLALAVLAIASLPFGTMWTDWVTVVLNSRNGGIAYSLQDVPILLLPIIAARFR